jgi:hypothetical protein
MRVRLSQSRTAFAHFEARSRAVLGREVPQVLLLHANRLNADHLEALLDRTRARGYRFLRWIRFSKIPPTRARTAIWAAAGRRGSSDGTRREGRRRRVRASIRG